MSPTIQRTQRYPFISKYLCFFQASRVLFHIVHELHMMHLNLLGRLPQKMNIVLEHLRRPELHMRLNSLPANRQHRSIPLHTLPLNLFLRNTIRPPSHVGVAIFLACLDELLAALVRIVWWAAFEVEGRYFGYWCTHGRVESSIGFEVLVLDSYVSTEDGLEVVAEGCVDVFGHEVEVGLFAVPVYRIDRLALLQLRSCGTDG